MKKSNEERLREYDAGLHRRFTGKVEAHKAFNTLRGIVNGIYLDKKINSKEVEELDNWCTEHNYLTGRNPFRDIITNIQVIISDNEVTGDEIEDMKWLCDQYAEGFSYYDDQTTDIQILQGICHGILADGKINDNEVINLQKWLVNHEHLASLYPYDEIMSIVMDTLSDGKVDDHERKVLKKYFAEFVPLTDKELQQSLIDELADIRVKGICAIDPEIEFDGKEFCFTGKTDKASRTELKSIIIDQGGIFKNTVRLSTDYLIIGNNGNPCWAYSCYGRKVDTAIKNRKKGNTIVIVNENDFWDALEK